MNMNIGTKYSNFLSNLQKQGKDAFTGVEEIVIEKLSQDVIAYIDAYGEILKRVTKHYELGSDTLKFPVLQSNRVAKSGKKGTVNNDEEQNITVGILNCTLREYADYITVGDAERNLTPVKFRNWVIKTLGDVILSKLEGDIITLEDLDSEDNEYIGTVGITSDIAVSLGVTKEVQYDPAKTIIEAINKTGALIKIPGGGKIDVIIHPEDFATMLMEPIETEKVYEQFNFIKSDKVESIVTATDQPSFVIGNLESYVLHFQKGSVLQIGNASLDRNRKNDIFAHSDVLGAPTLQDQFAVIYKVLPTR